MFVSNWCSGCCSSFYPTIQRRILSAGMFWNEPCAHVLLPSPALVCSPTPMLAYVSYLSAFFSAGWLSSFPQAWKPPVRCDSCCRRVCGCCCFLQVFRPVATLLLVIYHAALVPGAQTCETSPRWPFSLEKPGGRRATFFMLAVATLRREPPSTSSLSSMKTIHCLQLARSVGYSRYVRGRKSEVPKVHTLYTCSIILKV